MVNPKFEQSHSTNQCTKTYADLFSPYMRLSLGLWPIWEVSPREGIDSYEIGVFFLLLQ